MSSILVRIEGGDWVPVQPGRAHAGTNDQTLTTRSHQDVYVNKPIDPRLIGVDCIVIGHLSMYDFTPTGNFAATIRVISGAPVVQTYGAFREWTGGVGVPGDRRRTSHWPFMLLVSPTAATLTFQVRVDMGGTGTFKIWNLSELQGNMFIFPVWTS